MNRIKFLEIRDIATFIPVIAIDCGLTGDPSADYLLERAGYGDHRYILLTRLEGGKNAEYDTYEWRDRTYAVAHQYIIDNWSELTSGDVVDVQYILGETKEKKRSERYDEY